MIGEDVHTGSNSVLVAPITVGAGATIAAGSTVIDSVPAGKLTVARARQTTIENWQRPRKPPRVRPRQAATAQLTVPLQPRPRRGGRKAGSRSRLSQANQRFP